MINFHTWKLLKSATSGVQIGCDIFFLAITFQGCHPDLCTKY